MLAGQLVLKILNLATQYIDLFAALLAFILRFAEAFVDELHHRVEGALTLHHKAQVDAVSALLGLRVARA